MHQAVDNSILTIDNRAPARQDLVSLQNWWLGCWWRTNPPAAPIAFVSDRDFLRA